MCSILLVFGRFFRFLASIGYIQEIHVHYNCWTAFLSIGYWRPFSQGSPPPLRRPLVTPLIGVGTGKFLGVLMIFARKAFVPLLSPTKIPKSFLGMTSKKRLHVILETWGDIFSKHICVVVHRKSTM